MPPKQGYKEDFGDYPISALARSGDEQVRDVEPIFVSIHSQAGFPDDPDRGGGWGLSFFPDARHTRRRLLGPMGGLWHPL